MKIKFLLHSSGTFALALILCTTLRLGKNGNYRLVVGLQTVKSASVNPVKCLKDE